MSQGTHPPDTVWCVVEPDMCMYKIDAAARLELVQARMPEEKFADYESFAESIEDPKAKATFLESLEKWRDHQSVAGIQHAPWPAAATSEPSPHVLPPWRRSQVPKRAPPKYVPVLDKADKASSEKTKMNQISEELLDLVLYFNAACRCGRKGLHWCGWTASQWTEKKKVRSTSPAAGAHLVMVSTEGARFLMQKRDEIPNMHMGNFLSKLCGLKWHAELGAAYLQPPVGSYSEHESSTTPGQVLMSHFDARWAQEGTRPHKPHHVPRYICGFTEQGPANYLHKMGLDFSNEEIRSKYLWYTEPPKPLRRQFCGLQVWHRDISKDPSSPCLFAKKRARNHASSQPHV